MASKTILRKRLGQTPALGTFWMAVGDPSLSEIAAHAAPDAFIIDTQHGTFSRPALEAVIGTLGDIPVLVRTADGSHSEIARALDAGAKGVLVPLIETAAQATQAADAARFPPQGSRSGGGIRPLSGDFAAYVARCESETIVGVMIETARGLANAEAIAAAPGIDFVFIGTGDLAISLGCFPTIDQRHEDACRAIKAACAKVGMPCGIFTTSAEAAIARAQEGYDLVVVANDIGILASGFQAARATFATISPKI